MESPREFREAFLEAGKTPPAEKVPLAGFSSFGIGGPADFFFEARSIGDLGEAAGLACRYGVPFQVVGGGFNILFDDEGFRGLIIRNAAQGIVSGGDGMSVLSGTALSRVVQDAQVRGLSGLEFLAGIPGTVGGAIYGNAGAFGLSVGERVASAILLDPTGIRREAGRKDLGFEYRRSALQGGRLIVLEAVFALSPGDPRASEALIRDYLGRRRTKHPPWGTACAGSYFKNPCLPGGAKAAAGMLLEQAGVRGLSVGGAAVYEGHCNFIVNTGNATARDVLALAAEMKDRVYAKFQVRLEEEVIFLPATAARP